ncbi:hypothetical protein BJV82DRAFT_112960 [Fennellomyces sp. T-0311]|nr:hypothetical protein BJV82DRAFT_112960 [Fennellomyces sp. T-0311]
MSQKKVRCHACRKRQRGCFWESQDAQACQRCTQLKIDCIPFNEDHNDDSDLLPMEFNDKEVEYWRNEITGLDEEMRQLEIVIKTTSSKVALSQKQLEWDLTIENGLLKLHTDIQSIQELLLYSQAFIKHIVPLQGLFKKETIRFESMSFHIITSTFRLLLASCEQHITVNRAIHRPLHFFSLQHAHHQSIINHLVQIYVNRKNSRRLFVHIPTFLQHYQSLDDPLECPITLAICVHTICTTRHAVTNSAIERREMADFFYDKCTDILFEMFDDPTKKLETLFTINLLQHYIIFVLLRVTEARRLATIAYTLCKDLEPNLRHGKHPGLPWSPEVLRVLFQRHNFYAESTLTLLDFMIDENKSKSLVSIEYLDTISDEDDTTREFIDMHNHLLQLCSSPYMAALTRSSKVMAGDDDKQWDYECRLEAILRLDSAIRDWWNELPSNLRLCDELYPEHAVEMIDKNNSVAKAVIFCFVHSILLKVYICVLNLPATTLLCTDEQKKLFEDHTKFGANSRSCELVLRTVTRMFRIQEDMRPRKFSYARVSLMN